jgi:hypothetical protein
MKDILQSRNRKEFIYNLLVFLAYLVIIMVVMRFL